MVFSGKLEKQRTYKILYGVLHYDPRIQALWMPRVAAQGDTDTHCPLIKMRTGVTVRT